MAKKQEPQDPISNMKNQLVNMQTALNKYKASQSGGGVKPSLLAHSKATTTTGGGSYTPPKGTPSSARGDEFAPAFEAAGGIDYENSDGSIAGTLAYRSGELSGGSYKEPEYTVGVNSSKKGEELFRQHEQYIQENDQPVLQWERADVEDLDPETVDEMERLQKENPGISLADAKIQAVKGGSNLKMPDLKEKTATYVDPETEATETTTGPNAGSPEEVAKMKEQGKELSESTGQEIETRTPEEVKLKEELDDAVAEVNSFKSQLIGTLVTDKELRSEVRNIERAYNNRIREMEDITRRQVKSVNTLGVRMGSRWTGSAGGVWGGIISDAERQGLMKVVDIETQKQGKIIEAKNAARDQNFQVYAALMGDARTLATAKAKELADLKTAQAEADKELADKKRQIGIEDNIVSLMQQGLTTPDQIFDYANRTESGELIGDITLEEISTAMKVLSPPDELEGLGTDYRTFAHLQSIGDPMVSGMSYLDYKRAVANAGRAPTKSTVEERKMSGMAELNDYVTADAVLPEGNPVLGQDGKIGADGWKYLIEQVAPELSIGRDEFINEFFGKINTDHWNQQDLPKYGFNPKEVREILGYKDGDAPT